MKSILAFATLLLLNAGTLKPIENHVKWGCVAKRTGPTEAVIFLKASIDKGWHIYSQHIDNGGPTKTVISFLPANNYQLVGKTIEPKGKVKFDRVFKMNVSSFEEEVVFQQKIN